MNAFNVVYEALPKLLIGMKLTIQITFIGLIFAILIGLIACLMNISNSKILKVIASSYIYIIRGTPLLVQLFFLYFGIAKALPFSSDAISVGTVAISLNAGAYIAEIFRGSIQAINKGQMEAARSLGLPYSKAMIKVILPQAFRMSIPALTNQVIISLKDVSLISTIGVAEIFQVGKIIVARNMESTLIWSTVGVIYLIVVAIITKLARILERRMFCDQGKGKKST
ncbi:amino acid ABC transporter permease [Sinanaerobacter sp. ZZT-01]|uniref:amino acid ABC transporter permease n=1 Tax=Sinanaerobacter sp. ZZT-01 TaxID=3111540 RepID=UPI002D787E7F|nr:amino acid ABC transporter permease [Sinanaerobacter sp. ZZT-01]WRR92254.1 amino acid ABC transporter permease [Sinanaerobacter sp. ZZT-01]